MQGMTGGPMKPEEMMRNMMGNIPSKERMAGMMEMMPRCMNMLFSQLDPQDRAELAREMLRHMQEELKKYAAGSPSSAGTAQDKGPGKAGEATPETEEKSG